MTGINNYAVTPPLLTREGMEHRVEELTELAVDLAEQACSRSGRRPRLAGSLPPLETSYRADLVKGREEVLDGYRRIASVLAPRVDLMVCETLASSQEAVWACQAASETVEPGDGGDGVEVDPESAQQKSATPLDPEAYSVEVQRWLDAGASIVGGCCRTRPEHIRRLKELLES